jgi:antitoxin component of MazEF toxin-antitoxin module
LAARELKSITKAAGLSIETRISVRVSNDDCLLLTPTKAQMVVTEQYRLEKEKQQIEQWRFLPKAALTSYR